MCDYSEYTICDLVLPNLDNLDKLFLEAGNFLKYVFSKNRYDRKQRPIQFQKIRQRNDRKRYRIRDSVTGACFKIH